MLRKKLALPAIVIIALLSFLVLSGSASAASAHSHTGSQVISKLDFIHWLDRNGKAE